MRTAKEKSSARFYKEVSVAFEGKYYSVNLDGRRVYTPAANRLSLPSLIMAKNIALEWQNQETTIDPTSMPLMQIASTAIDRVAPQRETIIEEILAYGGADLLCYRAEKPIELVKAQAKSWQPVLDWLAREKGACLKVTSGIAHREQDKDAMEALYRMVASFENFQLTAVLLFAQSFSSLTLSLAVVMDQLGWEEAMDLAFLDETFQAERWGEDHESITRLKNIRTEVEKVADFLSICRDQ